MKQVTLNGPPLLKNKYASTNIAATRVLANTKQKTKSISQYQTNKKRISEREKADFCQNLYWKCVELHWESNEHN